MKERAYNFSAGPSMLPEAVLKDVAAELLNYKGCGESVMEMSHRSAEFKAILADAEANLREIMNIPDNYRVLFIQGGGAVQFAMAPLNLAVNSKKIDFVITGQWSDRAYKEAVKMGYDARIISSSKEDTYTWIPKIKKEDIRPDADYVHICFNNTIYGTKFPYIPETGDIPLVADMSSCILSEELDVTKFGVIWAGVQKNIAPAGIAVVIIREDLIGKAAADIPNYLDYKVHADNDSSYNTPNTFAIYVAGEVFKHIKANGGVAALEKKNIAKANKLYDYIGGSGYYKCPVNREDRSLMNVVFVIGDTDAEKKFVAEAKAAGLHNLGGHRTVGGMRASIYNAMPEEGVDALIEFMKKFAEENKWRNK
ncbi:MAG: 3-phosphoserine/phosphohydroxythreonine transaminase [Lentihominibacter sp.]